MPADAPEMLVALRRHDVVADHDVVDVGGLVAEVVQPLLVAADAEEGMVVDKVVAAIEAVERAGDVVLAAGVHLIRAAEAEHLAIPADGLRILRGMHDEMAEALDVRRAALDALVVEGVASLRLVFAAVDRRALHRDFRQLRHAVDYFDLEPVRVGQADALAAARLVDR